MVLRISSVTKEYVKVPVQGFVSGGAVDLEEYPVSLAFMEEGVEPDDVDFVTGDWEIWPGKFYMARCLVGPGSDIALVDGRYDTWINIISSQENVKRLVGKLIVT